MIRIGICEDDSKQRQNIREHVERALFKRTEYMISEYSSGKQVVDAIENEDFPVDLLLLDINMNELDGLNTADYIRKQETDVDIIFVTVSGEHVYEGYLYKAYNYLLKNDIDRRLEVELNRYLDEIERVSVCMEVTINGTKVKLPISKIYYLESNARKVIAHVNGEDVEFYSKLDDLETMLSAAGFFRVHQSYLVNGQYVNSISRDKIVVNNDFLPISRKYYERMKSEGKFS